MKSFEGSFRNLNFSPSTSILLNFFFPFIDITCFFSSLKLQYCRTIVLQIKLKLFKETSFSKATTAMQFPAKKNTGCPKAPRNFPSRKDGILHPRRVALGLPLPSPRVCTDGQAAGRTLTSQPKFLGSIGYQICLPMVFRELRYNSFLLFNFHKFVSKDTINNNNVMGDNRCRSR